jgi:P pilus assembly chaperone PapD
MSRKLFIRALSLVLITFNGAAHAAISLSGTRLVFDEGRKEETVTVRNDGGDIVVQSWVESEQGSDLPFAITPPLVRVAAKQQQLLRVLFSGSSLPSDRESIFWLNVQEIPQSAGEENTLQLAVRQRIKVFYRPKGLPGTAFTAPEQLEWRLLNTSGGQQLQIKNPTPYYTTLIDLVLYGSKENKVAEARMLTPGEVITIPLSNIVNSKHRLEFGSINDYGGRDLFSVEFIGDKPAKAKRL